MRPLPKIEEMIVAKEWKVLARNTLPVNIADTCSFPESMRIAHYLVSASADEITSHAFEADLMRDYAVNLMKILMAKYPKEWNEDWKNEAYLGITCALVFREEEAFIHVQNAYRRAKDAPQALLLAYINAGSGADHQLTKEQITGLSRRLIEQEVTYESAFHMASLAYEQGDFDEQRQWEAEALSAREKGMHTPDIIPDVLVGFF